jgi:hypothetical protein
MKKLTTQIFKVNGKFDIYADENTKRVQDYSELAVKMGREWKDMSKRSKSNFRKRHADKIKEIPTKVKVFDVSAIVPDIFGEYQLKEAAINNLIHKSSSLFLKCKNGKTGYSTGNFLINKVK